MVGMLGNTLNIYFTSQDFPSGRVRPSGYLSTDWNEILWATLTVGRPNRAYVFRHGTASYYEALFRLSLVRMALEQYPYRATLYRTEAFRSLDLTEKGAVSYFLGMAFCKLFASRLLDTPWLLHLDVFREELDPSVLAGRSRPDLVGQDPTGAWYAFESKGRSSVPGEAERRNAKNQARRLVRIGSTDCSLHIAAISYFHQDELQFHWRDPKPEDPEKAEPFGVRLPEDGWRYYYAPALALAAESEIHVMEEDRSALDIKVEIHTAIHELLLEGRWTAAYLLARELRLRLEEDGFQADGLRVEAGQSWREQR